MAVLIACLVLFLTMTGYSDAAYCVCSGGTEQQQQKNIDYACGAGADCTPILQNGPCYNPNSVRDHCNYAVNSYYQRKGQGQGSCDFSGTATVTQTAPNVASGCVYPSSPSNAGGTPSTNNPSTSTGNTSQNNSPTFGTPGSTTTPGIGLGPSGNGISSTDNGSGTMTLHHNFFSSLAATLLLSGLICLRF